MAEFRYQPLIELGEDKTEYYLLTKDYVLYKMPHRLRFSHR